MAPCLAVALLSCACGKGPLSPDAAARSVRVMTFNIQHGIDGSQTYRLQTAIDTIARVNPDVVALQEVTRNHPFYNCDDQPAQLARRCIGPDWPAVERRLQRAMVHARPIVQRRTVGVMLLNRKAWVFRTSESAWTAIVRGVVLEMAELGLANSFPAAVSQIVVTSPGVVRRTCHARRSRRRQPVLTLLPRVSEAQERAADVLVGDFNALPTAPELQPISAAYHDAWADAVQSGTAREGGLMASHTRPIESTSCFTRRAPESSWYWAETVEHVRIGWPRGIRPSTVGRRVRLPVAPRICDERRAASDEEPATSNE